MKNFGNSSRGRSQGVPKFFRAPMYMAHCAFIFAIAQLSREVPQWLYISKFTRLRAVSRRQHGSCFIIALLIEIDCVWRTGGDRNEEGWGGKGRTRRRGIWGRDGEERGRKGHDVYSQRYLGAKEYWKPGKFTCICNKLSLVNVTLNMRHKNDQKYQICHHHSQGPFPENQTC